MLTSNAINIKNRHAKLLRKGGLAACRIAKRLCMPTFFLEQSHQIFYCLAAADKLYASVFADENLCRTRAAVVG